MSSSDKWTKLLIEKKRALKVVIAGSELTKELQHHLDDDVFEYLNGMARLLGLSFQTLYVAIKLCLTVAAGVNGRIMIREERKVLLNTYLVDVGIPGSGKSKLRDMMVEVLDFIGERTGPRWIYDDSIDTRKDLEAFLKENEKKASVICSDDSLEVFEGLTSKKKSCWSKEAKCLHNGEELTNITGGTSTENKIDACLHMHLFTREYGAVQAVQKAKAKHDSLFDHFTFICESTNPMMWTYRERYQFGQSSEPLSKKMKTGEDEIEMFKTFLQECATWVMDQHQQPVVYQFDKAAQKRFDTAQRQPTLSPGTSSAAGDGTILDRDDALFTLWVFRESTKEHLARHALKFKRPTKMPLKIAKRTVEVTVHNFDVHEKIKDKFVNAHLIT